MKKKGRIPVTRVKNPEPDITDPDWVIWAAWADRITFEEIEKKTGKNESEVIKIMRRSIKPAGLILLLIILITSDSFFPVFFSISSKVILSAHAAQITQSGSVISGSGFLTRVTGMRPFFFINPL